MEAPPHLLKVSQLLTDFSALVTFWLDDALADCALHITAIFAHAHRRCIEYLSAERVLTKDNISERHLVQRQQMRPVPLEMVEVGVNRWRLIGGGQHGGAFA